MDTVDLAAVGGGMAGPTAALSASRAGGGGPAPERTFPLSPHAGGPERGGAAAFHAIRGRGWPGSS